MDEAYRMRKSEQIEVKTELVVYSCHHIERGLELHTFVSSGQESWRRPFRFQLRGHSWFFSM